MIQRATKDAVEVLIELIDFHEHNPNEMSDMKFNALVERIKEQGFRHPIDIIPSKKEGRYTLVAGEHRLKAMRVLGEQSIPAYIDNYDEDKAKFELIKDNVIKGNINASEFTKLVDSLSKKYDREVIAQLMAMEMSEFERFYKEIRDTLDPEMKKKLDEVKDEIKTIDDLALVLNKLFTEYGDTLKNNFMVLDYGGEKHIWVRCNDKLWSRVQKIKDHAEKTNQDINHLLNSLLEGSISLKELKGDTNDSNT
jgi:ParB/RepB/Spo0J family partition protein